MGSAAGGFGSLEGKVVIATGAASGMGRATALLCGALGASVVVADLNAPGAEAVAGEIVAGGGRALAYPVDLTVEEGVAGLVAAAVSEFGTVDVLHNNAFAVHRDTAADIVSTTLEGWEWTLRASLTSQFLCCRAVIPHMIASGDGSIINMSSGSGLAGGPSGAAYGAAKAGVVALTKYVATQYGKQGIRCNTVIPGRTLNTGWTMADQDTPEAKRVHEKALEDVLRPRLAVPEDIAPLIAFLASDGSWYVQAATIEINGGMFAHLPGVAGSDQLRKAAAASV